MLTPAIVDNTLNFLNRVPLTGPESYAWVELVNTLQATANMMKQLSHGQPGVSFQGPQQAAPSPQLDLEL